MDTVAEQGFKKGDLVTIKGSKKEERFCIIGFRQNDKNEKIAILKALFNENYVTEKPLSELKSLLIKGLL